jgi:hypothetical protein
MLRISEDGKTKYWHSPRVTGKNLIDPKTADYQVIGLGSGSLITRKGCFDAVGLFDENFPRLVDLEYFIRLSQRYTFHHIKEPLVKYYDTPGISSNADALVTAQNLLLHKYSEEVKNHRRFMAKQYCGVGTALCADKQIEQGRSYLFKAVGKYPVNIKYLGAALASLLGQNTYNLAVSSYRKIRDIFPESA